ncbi:hypothetical protein COK86_20400 [Bacillus cereus]|uniref:Uncharacterized protein n=1 Tax=Bacillus cereus TaxID=1396 RepID=A0A2B3TZV8_BACCE|nr:hypothetical protein [Bacillus cereus]PFU40156.1 hypothetical protein COK86_20400 [Bacillus cereus]
MEKDKYCVASTDTKQNDKEVIKQVHIYLPTSLHEQIKEKAKDDITGVATYIRKVLNRHVNNK